MAILKTKTAGLDDSNHRKASSIKGQALAKSLSSKSKEKLEENNVVRGEEEDEDEEPVTKRRRRGIETSEAKVSSKKSESKPTTAQKEPKTSKIEEKHPRAPKTPSESSKPLKSSKSTSAHKSDTTKSSTTSKASKVEPDPEEAPAKDEASASEEDEDDAESEEEDKSEVAVKAREKVQATLKGSGKDPYPDWKPGEPVPYAALCTTFSLIEMTTKRLIISSHCSLFLRQVLRLTPDDLLPTVQLMINKLAADYAGIELGIGESLIMKAIGETTGRSLSVIKADQNQIGDLGLVAAKSRSNQPTMFKPKPLTIRGVLDGLMGIAIVSGHGSQDKKIAGIKKLLSAADTSAAGKGSKGIDITKDKGGASETKFIIRFLEGKLRLGLAEKTILVALAHAMVIHETEKKGNKVPSSDALTKGEAILKTVFRYDSLKCRIAHFAC